MDTLYKEFACASCDKFMNPFKVTYDFDRDSRQTKSSKWVPESNFTQRKEYVSYSCMFKIQTCECGHKHRTRHSGVSRTSEPTGVVFAARPCLICEGTGKVASANPPAYEYDRSAGEWVWVERRKECDACMGKCWV